MQTDEWMAYSCSAHFSDQFSYIKHFISNYGLQDMIYARFTQILQFFRKQKKTGTFLTERMLATVADRWGQEADADADWTAGG
jgi:hypothetical protein